MSGSALDGLVPFAVGSAGFIVVLAALLWRRRDMPGAVPLTFQAVLISALCLVIAAESAAAPSDARMWFLVRDSLILPSGILILWFALEYASLQRYLSRPLIAALIGSVVVHFALYAPDGGRLLWSRLWWDGEVHGELAPLGVLFTAMALLLFVVATLILVVLFVRSPAHRLPVGLILSGHVVVRVIYPLAALNVIELTNVVNVLAFDFAALMYAVALLRFRLFDLVPVARKTIIERMRDAILVLDARDRIADLNDAARGLFDHDGSKFGGMSIEKAGVDPELIAALAPHVTQPFELRLRTTSGERAVEVTSTPLSDWQDSPIGRLVQIHDITDLRAAENRLIEQERALAAALERERLARDLHDSFGQVLGYVGLEAATMRKLMADGRLDDVSERLERVAAIAADAQDDVRRTIAELSGPSGPTAGLVPALRSRLAACERDYGMDVSLSVGHGLEDLSVAPADASQLLRIVDEALANATRHGGANVVHVTLDTDTDARVLALAIADDGAGFEAAALQHAGDDHYGLRFMRQRAEGLGGSLEISSAPGSGTTLIVRVPHEVNAEVGSK